MVFNHQLTVSQESSESLKPNNYVKELNMSNTIFVPKLKHQQLLDLVIAEDRKQKKKEFEENLKSVESYFNQHRWWLIANEQMILDRETGLLWENIKSSDYYSNFNVYRWLCRKYRWWN